VIENELIISAGAVGKPLPRIWFEFRYGENGSHHPTLSGGWWLPTNNTEKYPYRLHAGK
jgi:hypothetical protein